MKLGFRMLELFCAMMMNNLPNFFSSLLLCPCSLSSSSLLILTERNGTFQGFFNPIPEKKIIIIIISILKSYHHFSRFSSIFLRRVTQIISVLLNPTSSIVDKGGID